MSETKKAPVASQLLRGLSFHCTTVGTLETSHGMHGTGRKRYSNSLYHKASGLTKIRYSCLKGAYVRVAFVDHRGTIFASHGHSSSSSSIGITEAPHLIYGSPGLCQTSGRPFSRMAAEQISTTLEETILWPRSHLKSRYLLIFINMFTRIWNAFIYFFRTSYTCFSTTAITIGN